MKTSSLLAAALACGLSACGTGPATLISENPTLGVRTTATNELRDLPPPARKLDVAVFAFTDQTGRYLPNNNFAEYSFAVTQGGATILINTLKDVGRNSWFTVLERNRLADLFQERQIIRANRSEAVGPNGQPLPPLGPLRNAGLMVTGGIIGYDSNVMTGGLGANFLGIGANTEYRRDNVSVYLRVISILTGEVLISVTTDKTIYSVAVQGLVSRYVGFNKLLGIEGGLTTNEPRQLAVRQAIEKAVYAMVMEGAERNYWSFADQAKGRTLVDEFLRTRDGEVPEAVTAAPTPNPPPAAPAPRAEAAPLVAPAVAAARSEPTIPTPSAGSPPSTADNGVRTDLRGRTLTTAEIARVSIGAM